jgi:hypothetical protein
MDTIHNAALKEAACIFDYWKYSDSVKIFFLCAEWIKFCEILGYALTENLTEWMRLLPKKACKMQLIIFS